MSDAKNAEAVFLAALDKATPQERAAYVEGACGGDAALLARVQELLRANDQSQGPLDCPPPGIAVTAKGEVPGTVIGPYKLLELIGEGGMGTVWMAEQKEPIHRRVAVKVVKAGMDSKQVLARFEAERQALALMDHPNIARVLDAGTVASAPETEPEAPARGEAKSLAGASGSGRPFFVME